MNGREEQIQIRSASILDKTDWRRTIHKCLEACVMEEGSIWYPKKVNSLDAAVSAKYPGFDAKKEITSEKKKLEDKWNKIANDWIDENPTQWAYPWIKWEKTTEWTMKYSKELFEFIKDLLAKKRILLWGIRQTPGGTQMADGE